LDASLIFPIPSVADFLAIGSVSAIGCAVAWSFLHALFHRDRTACYAYAAVALSLIFISIRALDVTIAVAQVAPSATLSALEQVNIVAAAIIALAYLGKAFLAYEAGRQFSNLRTNWSIRHVIEALLIAIAALTLTCYPLPLVNLVGVAAADYHSRLAQEERAAAQEFTIKQQMAREGVDAKVRATEAKLLAVFQSANCRRVRPAECLLDENLNDAWRVFINGPRPVTFDCSTRRANAEQVYENLPAASRPKLDIPASCQLALEERVPSLDKDSKAQKAFEEELRGITTAMFSPIEFVSKAVASQKSLLSIIGMLLDAVAGLMLISLGYRNGTRETSGKQASAEIETATLAIKEKDGIG